MKVTMTTLKSTPMTRVMGDGDALDEKQQTLETMLAVGGEHARAARAQRAMAARKIKEAIEWAKTKQGVKKRCLVVDYCQNMQYPWYGRSQPGEVYYFPHANVYCLGIVNVAECIEGEAEPRAHMHAHIYDEGEGDGGKGGDNVASLILKQIKHFGWLEEIQNGEAELTIIFDNCPGQNKNNMVLRIAPYLVEHKIFSQVTMLFLVAGHTKNIADRFFNLLKQVYRKAQVWGIDMFEDLLTSKYCTVHRYVL